MSTIVAEAPGYLQVFSDGSVHRSILESVPPSTNSYSNGFKFKDVTIDPSKPVTARLFIPDDHSNHDHDSKLLPVLVYFHGGGFCIGSTTWLGYHHFLGDLCSKSRCIVLSVDYRLAPEHRLPVAYEDCYQSLEWLTRQQGQLLEPLEPWVRVADLSRVFLSGDSAGANISHHVAIIASRKNNPVSIKGLLMIHPYFGSESRTAKEMADDGSTDDVKMNDLFWKLSIPEGSNRDYYGCNVEKQDISVDEWSEFPVVTVYVAGLDFLKERGVMYAELLARKGVKEVTVVEAEDQPHIFHVFDPESDATRLLQSQMSKFMEIH
ncbi:Probable carboxylesterase 17 [Linum grandiflorum]